MRPKRTGSDAPYGPGETHRPTHGSDAAYGHEDSYRPQDACGSEGAYGTDGTYGPGPAGFAADGYAADGYGADSYAADSYAADSGYRPGGAYRPEKGYGPGGDHGSGGHQAGRRPGRRPAPGAPRTGARAGARSVLQSRPTSPDQLGAPGSEPFSLPGHPAPQAGGRPGLPPDARGATPPGNRSAAPPGRGTALPEQAGPGQADKPAKPGTALALRTEPPAKRPATDAQAELAEFAKDLRELRIKAGLGYPEMAELSHYTMKTLAAAAGGLNLPTLPVTAAYARACDGNAAEWEDRWHRVADAIKTRDDGTPEPGRTGDGTAGGSAPGGTGTGPAGKRAGWKRAGWKRAGWKRAGQRRPAGHSVRRTGRSARPAAVPDCLPTSGPGGAVRPGCCSAAPAGSRAGAGLRHHVRRPAAPLPVSSGHGHRLKPGKTTPSVLRPPLLRR